MKRIDLQSGFLSPLAMLAAITCAPLILFGQSSRGSAGYFPGGSVSGTIVDGDGVPQMGALVQLLLPDSVLAATATTDTHGRYRLSDLSPGNYRVRVSAALFLPVIRQHLQVVTGSRSVVNLTLSTLLAPTGWLPATRRSSGEGDDDWMWTLRSSTMRPVLRLEEEGETGQTPVSVSSSAAETHGVQTKGRVTVEDDEGRFARGGTHNIVALERRTGAGTVSFLRSDFSGPRTPFPVNPSADLTVGVERWLPLGAYSRTVLTYGVHPELQVGGIATGAQSAELRNAQRMELGDSLRVDVGSVIRDVNLGGNAFVVEPFMKLALRPAKGVVIAYTYTASRGTESLEDLDRVQAEAPVALMHDGHLRMERDRHSALSLSGETPHHGVVSVAVYRDSFSDTTLAGSGAFSAADAGPVASISDPTTATFRVRGRDYQSTGVRLVLEQPITESFSMGAAFADGRSLVAELAPQTSLAELVDGLRAHQSLEAEVSMDGRFARTGTRMRAGYRWQPNRSLTAVDSFRASDETAYLHCKVRQSLRALPMLPEGLEAVIDLQNLLAQGYQPFLSHDGHTLYLTQTPRTLQAGLSFTF